MPIDAPNCHVYKATCSDQRNKSVKYNLKFCKHLMGDATLFDFIYFGFTQWCCYEYIRHTVHYFCLGFVLWTFLEVDWKLFLLLKRVMNERRRERDKRIVMKSEGGADG